MARGTVMAEEMRQQPAALARLLAQRERVRRMCAPLRANLRGIILISRGSSDNAATYARYALELAAHVPVVLAAPSLYTRYRARTDYRGYVAIATSQSGDTPEIVSVLHAVGRAGAHTIAVTNDETSRLAGAARQVLPLAAGEERAVPATKTFINSLLAFTLLAEGLGAASWTTEELASLPERVATVLADEDAASAAAGTLAAARGVTFVGRGYLYAVALEGALKLTETAGLPAIGFSAADFLHGPVSMAGPDVPVVALCTAGPVLRDVEQAATIAVRRAAPTIRVRTTPGPAPGARRGTLWTGTTRSEPLAVFGHTVRCQQLALRAATALGRDPDRPAGLRKITATG